jgi:hypothetical protein
MRPVVDIIGIPHLSEEELELLAEKCENEISNFVFQMIPPKSIEELSVSCSLDLNDQLDLDVQIDLVQKYETGQPLDNIIQQATEHGVNWLDHKLQEMKGG